jgi:hypothetical protein
MKSKVTGAVKTVTSVEGLKSVAKKAGKVGGAALVLGATGGTGGVAALAAKKSIEKTTYKVDRWGPLSEDKSMVGLHYSPSAALDKEDFVTITGTPFDGKHKVKRGRTRNDVWIQPGSPVTETGTSGEFRVQTSVGARLRNLGAAPTAAVRTGAKKAGSAIKKVAGSMWDRIKKYLMILVGLLIVFFVVKTVIAAKIAKSV